MLREARVERRAASAVEGRAARPGMIAGLWVGVGRLPGDAAPDSQVHRLKFKF